MSTEPDNVPLPFLVQAPPPLVVRGLSYTIIISFSLAVVFSVVIQLPVTVTGRFVLVPVRGTDPVRATRGGIMTDVNVKEGDKITLGAPLFILRSEFTANRVGEARTLEIRIEGAEGRIKNARKKHDSQVKADEEQANGFRQRIASLGRTIELTKKNLEIAQLLEEKTKKLYDEHLGVIEPLLLRQMDVIRANVSLVELGDSRAQANSSLSKLHHEMDVRASELDEIEREQGEDLRKSKTQLETLRETAVASVGDRVTISAPCDGVILRLRIKAAGAVVNEGDVLAEVACAGEKLEVDVSVEEKGAGIVKIGQPIKLFYDAFPYERHGVRYGDVRFIGPSGVAGGAVSPPVEGAASPQPLLRLLGELREAREFRVGGAAYPLFPGMSGRAEIMVERRSVLSYVFAPILGLRETMEEAPK